MADNDIDLDVQKQLNEIITKRNKLLEQNNKLLSEQYEIFTKLSGSKMSEEARKNVDGLNNTKDAISALNRVAEKVLNNTDKKINILDRDVTKSVKSTTKLTDVLRTKFPKAALLATTVVTGFSKGLGTISSIGKGVFNVLSTVSSVIWEITKSIFAIPFGIFNGLIDMANNFPSFTDIAQAFENVRREFGSFKELSSSTIISSFREIQGAMLTTGLTSFQVFDGIADMIDFANDFAKGMGATFALITDQIKGSFKEIVVFQKGLGITTEDFKHITNLGLSTGVGIKKIAYDIGNFSLQSAKKFGLSSKQISRDVAAMITDVHHFAGLSIKDLNDIAVYTRKLGVEFDKLTGFLDATDTFEGAANASARLSQALNVNIDTMALLKAEGADRVSILQDAFKEAGVSTEGMSRRMLQYTSSILNMDETTTRSILSTRGLSQSFEEVKNQTDLMKKKQLDMTTVLQQLGDNIERVVRQSEPKEGFFKAFVEGIEWGITRSGPFLTLMRNIKQSMMQVTYIGRELGKVLVQIVPGVKEVFTGLAGVFQPAKLKTLFKGISGVVKEFFDPENGATQLSFANGFDKLKEVAYNFYKSEIPSFANIGVGFKKFFLMFGTIIGNGIKYVATELTKLADVVTKFVINPSETFDVIFSNADKVENTITGTLSQFIINISKPLKNPALWNGLYDSFSKMFVAIGEKLKPVIDNAWSYLSKTISDKMTEVWSNMSFFNKALIVGALSASMLSVVGGIAGVFTLFSVSTVKMLGGFASGFTSILSGFAKSFGGLGEIFKGIGGMISGVLKGISDMFSSFSLKDLGKFAKAAIVGFVSLGATMTLMFASLKGAELASRMFDMSKLDNITKMLSSVSYLYITAAGILAASTLIGALQILGGPAAWGAQAAGFASLSVTVLGIAKVATTIISDIDKMPISEEITKKTGVFVQIVNAINGTLSTVAKTLDTFQPTFFELIFNKSEKKFESLNKSFNLLVGNKESNTGVYGIISTSLEAIRSMIPEQENLANSTSIFSNILTSVSSLIGSVTSGVSTMIGDGKLPNTSVLYGTEAFLGSITMMINRIVTNTIESISKISMDKTGKFEFINKIMTVISDVVDKLPKDIGNIGNTNFSSMFNKLGSMFSEESLQILLNTINVFQKYETSLLNETTQKTLLNMTKVLGSLKTINEIITTFPPISGKNFTSNTSNTSENIFISLPDIDIDKEQIKQITNKFKGIDLTGVSNIEKVVTSMNSLKKTLSTALIDLKEPMKDDSFSLFNKGFSVVPASIDIPIPDISFDKAKLNNLLKLSDGIDFTKFDRTQNLVNSIKGITESTNSLGNILSIDGIEKSFEIISKIVEQADVLNNKLTTMLAKPIELQTKLKELSNSLGLGKKQTYEIKNNGVEITINLEVKMEAGQVEEVIVRRSESKIRQAFNSTTAAGTLNTTLGPVYKDNTRR